MTHTDKLLVVCTVAALALGCSGSGGSDGAGGDGATAGVGAGTNGASGTGAVAGMGSGGTGVVTGTGGASGGSCGLCSVPACAPGETPEQGAGQCCPSCAIVGGGGSGGAGGTGGTGGAGGTGGEGGSVCNNCPATAPTAGAACEPCNELPYCTYNECAGTGRTVAQCIGDAWQVTTEACDATDCDGLKCGAQVCLTIQGQAAGDKRCADDPCASGPLTCECAASLCTGEFNADACRIAGPNSVQCYATSSGCTPDGICPP